MKLAVLATATDDACRSEAQERERFSLLVEKLRRRRVTVEGSWNLLGRYDYLLLLNVQGAEREAFAAMSVIAQSGTMRTESFPAIPLEIYFDLAREVSEE